MTEENIMAKTSFQGPVRSKNDFKLYSTTASTGVELLAELKQQLLVQIKTKLFLHLT
jgi:hypothetical protein